MSALEGARERARAEVTKDIVAEARRQLGEVGPDNLSLRAVARELGVVSSAVYRYVSSRDELLTLLIVDAYNSLGEHTEQAAHDSARRAPRRRWVDTAGAVRDWAVERPHEYALLYGTPVPGYRAPEETVPAGTRVSLTLLGIVIDAWNAGRLAEPAGPDVSATLRADFAALREQIDVPLPDHVLVRTLAAWSQLFGLLSFELFSQTRGLVTDHGALFRAAADAMAEQIGL